MQGPFLITITPSSHISLKGRKMTLVGAISALGMRRGMGKGYKRMEAAGLAAPNHCLRG